MNNTADDILERLIDEIDKISSNSPITAAVLLAAYEEIERLREQCHLLRESVDD